MSSISTYQNGQSALEIAPADLTILLEPYYGTDPITALENPNGGGLDPSQLVNMISVGNVTKRDGFKLTNNPTINNIMSTGKGTPTAIVASEAVKSVNYVPQEFNKINMQVYWGAVDSAFSGPSANGGFTLTVPELPANLFFRAVLLGCATAGDGSDVFFFYLANKVLPAKRSDQSLVDSNVIEHPAELIFLSDDEAGLTPLIVGACGDGWQTINTTADSGFDPAVTSITMTPTTATMTVATGAAHTKQLQVLDNNGNDVTDSTTYTSSATGIASVTSKGVITAVSAGSATITGTYQGQTATCAVTAS